MHQKYSWSMVLDETVLRGLTYKNHHKKIWFSNNITPYRRATFIFISMHEIVTHILVESM